MMELPEYLPLSYLNQLLFCARRFWLMYVQGEMEINAAVLEGQLRHGRAHRPGEQRDEHGRILRSVHVWSDALRVAGVADYVEETDGQWTPVEHKRGRMGRWLNDHVQLCAQAMCLEERTGVPIAEGEIFYWANRRRERIVFDEALRAKTTATAAQAFALLAAGTMPLPVDNPAKCRDCSLEPICLPQETRMMLKEERE
ncbi:MAG: CRISPR-associated protein Cas4 [Chloroflexota bacterium]|nr:CRISPR-associated protein Cas4 [Chloroflexota bacterium]